MIELFYGIDIDEVRVCCVIRVNEGCVYVNGDISGS